ncbi:ceramidase-domain-containing protein [Aspergillus filifer]
MTDIDSVEPFWGSPTSKANFCEADYFVSRYIAEFVNSLTNVVNQKFGARALPYWGLISVGVCSFAFHVSLKYHTQMMDDLSMQLTTTPVLNRVLTANSDRRHSNIKAIVLGALLFLLVMIHALADELILHSVSFVVVVTIIGVQTIRLVNSRTVPGSSARRQIWGIVRFGAAIFNLGYWLWILDQWACGFLTNARRAIGLPWGFLLELHGWWHISVIDHLLPSEEFAEDPRQCFAWPASWAATSIFAEREQAKVDHGASEKQQ